jgi:hypothetical protein
MLQAGWVGELVVPLLASDMGSQQPGHLAHRAQVADQVEQALRLTAHEQVWQVWQVQGVPGQAGRPAASLRQPAALVLKAGRVARRSGFTWIGAPDESGLSGAVAWHG